MSPSSPPRRRPIFAWIVAGCAGLVLALLHAARIALPADAQLEWLRNLAFVPARFWRVVAPEALAGRLVAAARDSVEAAQAAAFWLDEGLAPWSVITYIGVHADWTHALSNAALIALFGAPVARRLSAPRFLGVLALGAVAGAAAQMSALDAAFAPLVGASACVSALIGALARLWTEPGGFSSPLTPLRIAATRAPSLAAFAAGVAAMFAGAAAGEDVAAIGWRAHLAGFVCGFLVIGVFVGASKGATQRTCRLPGTDASSDSH